MSMAEVMGRLYGKYYRIITGVLGIIDSVCMIGMGLFVFSSVCESILHINPIFGVIIGEIIFSIYTAHGGIKAVVATDVLQFIALIVAVRDKRSLYIKIADRLHNLRTISHKDPYNQLKKAEETILFYLPLAEQLEMKSAAEEMRSISIMVLNGDGDGGK